MDFGYRPTKNCPCYNYDNEKEVGLLNWNTPADEYYLTAKPWFDEAKDDNNKYFKRFIDLWIVFNGWLSLIINGDDNNIDKDWYLVNTACCDQVLKMSFESKKKQCATFRENMKAFSDKFPVVSRRALIKYSVEPWKPEEPRRIFIERCEEIPIRNKPKYFFPKCFWDHKDINEEVPDDWAHTLQAIYGIRCDLFHGGKIYLYEADKIFVELAFKILWDVWGEEQLKKAKGDNKQK